MPCGTFIGIRMRSRRADILAVKNEIKTSLEKVDELVLRWMDMRRNECPRGNVACQ